MAYVLLPSVGSWLITPSTATRRAVVSSQAAWSVGVKSIPMAKKLMDAPDAPLAIKAKHSQQGAPFKLLPSVGTWHMPLPYKVTGPSPTVSAPRKEAVTARSPSSLVATAPLAPKTAGAPPEAAGSPHTSQPQGQPPAASPTLPEATAPKPPSVTKTPNSSPGPTGSIGMKPSPFRVDSVTSAGGMGSPGGSELPEAPSPASPPRVRVGGAVPGAGVLSHDDSPAGGAPPVSRATQPERRTDAPSASPPPPAAGAGGVRQAKQDSQELREFKVVVPSPYPGVQYRKSRNLNDRWPRYAQSNSIVRGVLEEDGKWFRIEDNIFIPMEVGKIKILEPYDPTQSALASADVELAQQAHDAPSNAPGAKGSGGAPSGDAAAAARSEAPAAPWWSCCVCNNTSAADTEVVVAPNQQRGGRGGRN